MKGRYLIFLLPFITVCCNSKDENGKIKDETEIKTKTISVNVDSVPLKIDDTIKDSVSFDTFIFQNDSINQTIEINRKGKKEIIFKYVSTNKKKGLKSVVSGIAKSNYGFSEIDEDETGLSYSCAEYVYNKKGCNIYIRISQEFDKIIIKEADCNYKEILYCPYSSLGILRKKSNLK